MELPEEGEFCGQVSSHDPTGGNADYNQFMDIVPHEDRSAGLIADLKGPGAVVRIWSASPIHKKTSVGNLLFFFDGEKEPRLKVDFKKFLRGELGEPFVPPLVQLDPQLKGSLCYVPIPYAKSLRILLDPAPESTYDLSKYIYYHLQYIRLADGDHIESFAPEKQQDYADTLRPVAEKYKEKEPWTPVTSYGDRQNSQIQIKAGGKKVMQKEGSGIVRLLQINASRQDIETLRNVLVYFYADKTETPTIASPLGDLFGLPFGEIEDRFTSLPIGWKKDEGGYLKFPMPFKGEWRLELHNKSAHDLSFDLSMIVEIKETLPDNLGFFHARWNRELRPPKGLSWSEEDSEKGSVHNPGARKGQVLSSENWMILQDTGRGRFVGAAYSMHGLRYKGPGSSADGYLEGDEMF